MTAMNLHRYPSASGGVAFGKIGARRTARVLPYDAEVEYLEADNVGLAINRPLRGVIDTGVVPNLDTDVWECDGQFVQFGNTAGCWGCVGNRFVFGRGSASWNDWYYGLGNSNNRTGVDYDNLRHTFRLDGPHRRLTIDSTEYNGSGTVVSGYGLTVAIFSRNSDNGIRYRTDNACSRLYSSKYYRNGVLIQHLIPVRFTNELGVSEGAVYDKRGVGGMNPDGSARTDGLYRNRGTGAFLYGNDI